MTQRRVHILHLLTAVILANGLLVLLTLVTGYHNPATIVQSPRHWSKRPALVVASDGRILLQTLAEEPLSHELMHTLSGELVEDHPHHDDRIREANLAPPVRPVAGWLSQPDLQSVRGWTIRSPDALEAWYLITEPGTNTAYYAREDRITRHVTGYIGANGFQTDRPDVSERFPHIPAVVDGNDWRPLDSWHARIRRTAWDFIDQCPNGVCLLTGSDTSTVVDLDNLTVRPGPDDVVSRAACWTKGRSPIEIKYDCIRFPKTILVQDLTGELVGEFPIPEDLQSQPLDAYYSPVTSELVLRRFRSDTSLPGISRITLRDGEIERVDIPNLRGSLWTKRPMYYAPLPLGPLPVFLYEAALAGDASPGQPVSRSLIEGVTRAHRELLLAGALGIISVLLLARHHRWQLNRSFWIWTAVVFPLGLAGYIGYRLHRPSLSPITIPPPEPTGHEILTKC